MTSQVVPLSNSNVVFQKDAPLFVGYRYRVTEQCGLDHFHRNVLRISWKSNPSYYWPATNNPIGSVRLSFVSAAGYGSQKRSTPISPEA